MIAPEEAYWRWVLATTPLGAPVPTRAAYAARVGVPLWPLDRSTGAPR